MGLEPIASALRGQRLNQFDYRSMVLGKGFEPIAFALKGQRLDHFDQPSKKDNNYGSSQQN